MFERISIHFEYLRKSILVISFPLQVETYILRNLVFNDIKQLKEQLMQQPRQKPKQPPRQKPTQQPKQQPKQHLYDKPRSISVCLCNSALAVSMN